MNENDIGKIVVDAAYHVHSRLGPGLLESVYETVFTYELRKRGLDVRQQVPIAVVYDDVKIDEGFRADMVVNDLVVIELKSIERILPVHKKQVLTYLKLMGKKLGFLINFNEEVVRSGITRLVNGLSDE